MDHIQFLIAIKKMYGNYRTDMEEEFVMKYLEENVPIEELPNVLAKVLTTVGTNFKTPPSIKKVIAVKLSDPIESKPLCVKSSANKKPYSKISVQTLIYKRLKTDFFVIKLRSQIFSFGDKVLNDSALIV